MSLSLNSMWMILPLGKFSCLRVRAILKDSLSEFFKNFFSDRIPVNIRLDLHGMECKYLGVDIQDEHGRHEVGYMENTKKDPINGGAGK